MDLRASLWTVPWAAVLAHGMQGARGNELEPYLPRYYQLMHHFNH